MLNRSFIIPLLLVPIVAVAQPTRAAAQAGRPSASTLRPKIDAWRRSHEREILDDAFALLSLPNVASDSIGIARNVEWLTAAFAKRGVAMRALRSSTGGSPALFGELRTPGATRTIVFYAHYDGQPVTGGGWDGDPFKPELRRFANSVATDAVALPARGDTVDPNVRIRARSASDDKGPIIAMLAALDALESNSVAPTINIKFFLEGEEEAGSDHLGDLLRENKSLLASDAWIFFDGPVHVTGTPQIVLGVRGVMGVDITFYGPNHALHSGHYGNWAPNPAVAAATFIVSVRDRNGRILIDDFYKDVVPITDADRRAARALAAADDSVRRSLSLAQTEGQPESFGERILLPALNVRGIRSGGNANAVPTSASVSIDFRLVPGQTPARVRTLVEAHLAKLGYTVLRDAATAARSQDRSRIALVAWDSGYVSVRVAAENPLVGALQRLSSRAYGRQTFIQPILGGSLPLYHFVDALGATVITVPIVNADNSQHAPNENLRIGNLWDGIALIAEIATGLHAELGSARIVP
jgi:acetylornithine deacetylase/succinyl-diaminopimelate desuccinylase-like protein